MSEDNQELTIAQKVEFLRDTIARVHDYPDKVTQWEQDFLTDFEGRLKMYGDRTRISEKQWAIIQRIADKT